jgi:hypothetical protein
LVWGPLTTTAIAVAVVAANPRHLVHPYGWWTIALIIGDVITPIALLFAAERLGFLVAEAQSSDTGNIIPLWLQTYDNILGSAIAFMFLPELLSFAIAPITLAATSLAEYLAITLGIQIIYWLTIYDICSRGRRYYLHRPNEFVDMYDDPRSRHWLGVKPSVPTAPAGQRTP